MFLLGKVSWLLAAAALALSLAVPNGYNFGIAILFIVSLLLPFLKVRFSLSRQDLLITSAFLIYFMSTTFFIYLYGWNTRDLDRPSRFLLVAPVLFLLLHVDGYRKLLWAGATWGAIFASVVALYERYYLGLPRAMGAEYPIMFGDTSILLGFISAVAALYFFSKRQYCLLTLAILGFIAGSLGSILSGSRGGWVGIPIILVFMLWHSRDLLGKRVVLGVFGLCLVGGLTVLAIPQLGVSKKIDQTFQSVQLYLDGEPNTSLGLRFEMWKASLYMFESSPVFGVGEYGATEFKQRLANEGIISEQAVAFDHAHNEYLNALSLTGIIGFLALMAVYLVPLRLFLRKMREYKHNWNVKAYAMAGALVPMSYMDFALSQSMFSHNIGVMMYVFPIVFFWAAVRWAEKEYTEGLAAESLKANKSD